MRARRGLSLVVLIVLIMALIGIGLALNMQARQAGRASHWFQHAQLAHNLADGALKFALHALVRHNGRPDPGLTPALTRALDEALAAVKAGQPGRVVLVGDGDLPEPLAKMAAAFPEHSPVITVRLEVLGSEPLWTGELAGIPAVAGERKGRVQLVASAQVKTPLGVPVQRTIALEQRYLVVSPLPSLLGRFALFVQNRGTDEPNAVPVTFDPQTGNATYAGAARPLTVRAGYAAKMVEPADGKLDRAAFVKALPDPKFLDRQGWVYLGGTANAPWKLNVAHGFGDGGESPLLRGTRERTYIRGTKADDEAFMDRYKQAVLDSRASTCRAYFQKPEQGAYLMHHGFATNYELIGLESNQYRQVQASGTRTRMKYPASETSLLRLFGSAAAMSPTLVFGPVLRAYLQRFSLSLYMGPPLQCHAPGVVSLPFFKLDEHGPGLRAILTRAFGSEEEYRRWGSTLRDDEPAVQGLNALLDAKGSGIYDTNGELVGAPFTVGTALSFGSDLLPWLGTLPGRDGIPNAVATRLANGDLDSPRVYRGKLAGGLAAFVKVAGKRTTFALQPDAVAQKVLVDGVLRVPGVAVVEQSAALSLGAVKKVEEGGILITRGPLEIRGDIVRGGHEPLTLVSLKGDVTVHPSVARVDAMLVALDGAVKLGGKVTVAGVAGRDLDLAALRGAPAERAIEYSPDMDPTGPQAGLLRVYYGGDERIAVSGAISP